LTGAIASLEGQYETSNPSNPDHHVDIGSVGAGHEAKPSGNVENG
jgi:hypothetical protein